MLRKPNKLDYTVVKSYRIVSLLNCLGKVYKGMAADMLADWCKVDGIVHERQMGSRRQRSTIDAVTRVTQQVQEAWGEEKMAGMLLMDIKEAFNHVSRNELIRKMEAMRADSDLVRWRRLFMLERKESLVIDGHHCEATEVVLGVPQGSPISLILFAVYLNGILREVERKVEGCMTTLFANDCGWLAVADSIPQLCERLEKAETKAIEWTERNHVVFNNAKDKAIVFTRRRKPYLMKRIAEAKDHSSQTYNGYQHWSQ